MDLDGIDNVLRPTRVARLALDSLLGALPEDMLTPVIENALWDVHEQLCEKELASLRLRGISRQYLIIRPIDPANLPSDEDTGKIAAAIRTLASLGLIAARGSDLPASRT